MQQDNFLKVKYRAVASIQNFFAGILHLFKIIELKEDSEEDIAQLTKYCDKIMGALIQVFD